jgi:hypothetical protein
MCPYYDYGNNSEQNTATEIESSSDFTTSFENSTDKSRQTVLLTRRRTNTITLHASGQLSVLKIVFR